MNRKESEERISQAEALLESVKILPDNLLYVNLYHEALAFNGAGKYELCSDICEALIKELMSGYSSSVSESLLAEQIGQ